WNVSLLRPTQLSGRLVLRPGRLGVRESRDGILQLCENWPALGLVHGQYRLPSHPSLECPHPFLPLAGGHRPDPRVEHAQDHLAPSVGDHPLSAFEGLGCPSATDGQSPGCLTELKPPTPSRYANHSFSNCRTTPGRSPRRR